jgi:hypothetical protein
MKNKSLHYFRKYILLQFILAVFILTPTIGFGQIVAWQFGVPAATGSETTYNATTNNENINTSILTRGAGIGVNPLANGFTSDNWNSSSPTKLEAITYDEYIEFKIQPKVGFSTSLSTLNAKIRRTSNGPKNYSWQYSINGVTFINIFDTIVSVVTDGQEQKEILLSSISELQNVDNGTIITFRIYAWGASNNDASFGFAKTTTGSTTNCLAIGGVVEALTLSSSASIANVSKTINSTATVEITSNTTWNAVSDQSWLNISGITKGNGTLTFTTTETNPTIFARKTNVRLSAANIPDRTITVTQEAGDATLSVSDSTASIAKAANSTANVAVTSNSTWTATSNQNWLTVTSGATGNATLICSATANPFITTRIAKVTIKATGVANQTIRVTQAAGDATLSVSSNNSTISKSLNSTSSITVTSNTKWTANLDQNWLTVSEGTTGNGQLTFTTLSINKEITTRFATVTLKANGAADQTVIVTQEAGDPTLSVSESMVSINKSANSIANIIVYTNSSWTAASDKTWLTVTAGAANYGKLTFTAVTCNPYLNTRSATVTVKVAGAADKTIYVTQAVGDAAISVSAPTLSIAKTANNSASVTVYSNTTWTVTSDAIWLTVSNGTSGDGILTISTTAINPEITTRSATVIIKASGSDDKTIIVTQEAGDATLSLAANTVEVAKTVGSSVSVSVTSNSPWTASSNQSWLSVTAGATGDGTLTINTTAANPTLSQRIATVIVKANGVQDQLITVTQAMGDTILIGWQFGTPESLGDENTYTATTNDTNLNPSILKRGTGILKYSLPRGFSSNTWNSSTLTNAISTNEYFEFSIQPQSGYSTSLNALNVVLRRSATGPKNYMWKYTTDGTTFTDISGGTVASSAVAEEGTEQTQVSLESITALQNIASATIVTFRIYAWGATNKDGTFAIGKTPAKTLSNCLAISGSVVRLPFITTSVSKVNLGVEANTSSSVNVTSNTTWSVTSDQSWLTVTSSNNGNATLTLTATSANLMANPRTATVTLKATNVVDKTITVTQAGSAPYLSVSMDNASINASENNTASIAIESNAAWTATSNAGWLTVGGGATGNAVLKVTATDTQEAIRQATITISAQGVPDKTVIVTQVWDVNAYKYQMNMTITAIVTVNDNELSTSDLQLSVFIGDECRGLAKLQYVDACKRYMAFMMVRGNSEDMNKTVTFRSLNLTSKVELSAINATLGFMPESRIGSAANPYPIRFVQMVTSTDIEIEQSLKVYPNPVKDVLHIDCQLGDIQELQLTDATGRNLIGYTKMNTNYINTSQLTKGVYFLHIKCNGSMSVHKIVKK